jgi:imidazolonepropionase-like amidohydrolase
MLGEPWHLELRQQLAEGEITGPRLITSGPSLNGNSVDSPEQGARMVREQAEAGYDFLKLHPGLDRERFDAIARAAEATGMSFAGHVSIDVGLERALEAGYASIDHLDRYIRPLVDSDTIESMEAGFFDYRLAPYADRSAIPAVAERTRAAGVWNVPTESLMQNYLLTDVDNARESNPQFRYLPESMVGRWIERVEQVRESENYDRDAAEAYMSVRRDLISALHESGAGLLLGSDAPQVFNVPGFSIHHEMQLMREAGLSPFEVLQTGTVNPARFFDAENDWGQVREGMRAELLLVEGNPLNDLENVSRIRGVMTPTGWLSRDAINDRLAEIESRYRRN